MQSRAAECHINSVLSQVIFPLPLSPQLFSQTLSDFCPHAHLDGSLTSRDCIIMLQTNEENLLFFQVLQLILVCDVQIVLVLLLAAECVVMKCLVKTKVFALKTFRKTQVPAIVSSLLTTASFVDKVSWLVCHQHTDIFVHLISLKVCHYITQGYFCTHVNLSLSALCMSLQSQVIKKV